MEPYNQYHEQQHYHEQQYYQQQQQQQQHYQHYEQPQNQQHYKQQYETTSGSTLFVRYNHDRSSEWSNLVLDNSVPGQAGSSSLSTMMNDSNKKYPEEHSYSYPSSRHQWNNYFDDYHLNSNDYPNNNFDYDKQYDSYNNNNKEPRQSLYPRQMEDHHDTSAAAAAAVDVLFNRTDSLCVSSSSMYMSTCTDDGSFVAAATTTTTTSAFLLRDDDDDEDEDDSTPDFPVTASSSSVSSSGKQAPPPPPQKSRRKIIMIGNGSNFDFPPDCTETSVDGDDFLYDDEKQQKHNFDVKELHHQQHHPSSNNNYNFNDQCDPYVLEYNRAIAESLSQPDHPLQKQHKKLDENLVALQQAEFEYYSNLAAKARRRHCPATKDNGIIIISSSSKPAVVALSTPREQFYSSETSFPQLDVEISPGEYRMLRGSKETKLALKLGFRRKVECMICDVKLWCVADCELVLCPLCSMISPILDDNNDDVQQQQTRYGLGLGVAVKKR